MANSFGGLTLVCLEIPWTADFGKTDDFTPECSVAPYLEAFAINAGVRLLHRHVHSHLDWSRWCKGLKHKKLGTRVLWVAGHGDVVGAEAHLSLLQRGGTRSLKSLSPREVQKGLDATGALDGIIIDACSFGKNAPENWLPNVVGAASAKWALAFSKDVPWTDSTFFALKTLEWLFDSPTPPTNSSEAAKRFRRGVEKGRAKSLDEQVNLTVWANALGARFFRRKQKTGWDPAFP